MKLEICKGINLYIIPDDKFKTFRAGVIFHTPLNAKTAAKNALVPMMLTSATKKYPDIQKLNRELLRLYGARLSSGVEKRGDIHAVSIYVDAVAGKYVNGDDVEGDVLSLFSDVLLNPDTDGNAFDKNVLEREKASLKKQIEGVINDKRRYALTRCIEEMCRGEAYGVRQWGRAEDVDKIGAEEIYEHYLSIIGTSPIDFVVAGSFDGERVERIIRGIAEKLGEREAQYPPAVLKESTEERAVTESADVQQGKLVLGFTTSVLPEDDEYFTLMVLNGVFGGGPSSKLFENVREKMSLCYYASSGLVREKGIMLAQAGIDFVNFEKTRDEIINQLEDIKRGNVTKDELQNAKSAIMNSLASYRDELSSLVGYYSSQCAFSKMHTIDEALEKISNVKTEQIIDAARQIKVDMVYFLCGTEVE